MSTFADSETRLRRFLRDPDGIIWSSMDLQTYFNDAQVEVAQKTNLLLRVEVQYYPPYYDWSYMHDFESGYLEGDIYQALKVNQADGEVVCFPWEAAWYLDTSLTEDDGTRFTHPWEVDYCNPADPPGILLPASFDKMKYIAYDRGKLEPKTEKELQDSDRYYRTRTGLVMNYWRPDDYSNLIYLFPRPTTIVNQGPALEDTFTDDGGINSSAEAWMDETDMGLITDVIDTADALFMVYSARPSDIVDITDESAFPDYLVKYVEYATLERAYGADTDGFIPSLRDYWRVRKDYGLKAVARFQRMILSDRDYRLGGSLQPTSSKRLRLPEGYPAI